MQRVNGRTVVRVGVAEGVRSAGGVRSSVPGIAFTLGDRSGVLRSVVEGWKHGVKGKRVDRGGVAEGVRSAGGVRSSVPGIAFTLGDRSGVVRSVVDG